MPKRTLCSDLSKLRPELRPAAAMVLIAYGQGLPEEDYPALLVLLRRGGMSFRALAALITFLTGEPRIKTYDDAVGTEADPELPDEDLERVETLLRQHGYAIWLQDNAISP